VSNAGRRSGHSHRHLPLRTCAPSDIIALHTRDCAGAGCPVVDTSPSAAPLTDARLTQTAGIGHASRHYESDRRRSSTHPALGDGHTDRSANAPHPRSASSSQARVTPDDAAVPLAASAHAARRHGKRPPLRHEGGYVKTGEAQALPLPSRLAHGGRTPTARCGFAGGGQRPSSNPRRLRAP
jgi:hypothetical protein